jgi:membrane-bound lytic murein transglycosylase F
MKTVIASLKPYFGYLICVISLFTASCGKQPTQLEQIKARGEITVITRNGPTTYYIEKDKETGLALELASRFAEYIGVSLNVIVAKNTDEVIKLLQEGSADFAAAALINNSINDSSIVFLPGHQWVTYQLVYRNGQRRPARLQDISPYKIHMAKASIPASLLQYLRENHPELEWEIHPDKDSQDLLEMLENGEIRYTIATSNELVITRHYYPEIRPALIVGTPMQLAWAFRQGKDHSLLKAAKKFQHELYESDGLADLIDYFYGQTGPFDYVDSRKFIDRYAVRLPEYRAIFEEAAAAYNLDWRLLAALSYQESHWNNRSLSPTGVRGLMMLTIITANSVGVSNRLDPMQSIHGGAMYLDRLMQKIPARISDPDRSWFALASYNVGFGHLEDARILTQRQGGDPDSWLDVKERLPLLSRKKWYQDTRFGYARGYETVRFVENIRRYYNILLQLTQAPIEPYQPQVETLYIDGMAL